MRSATRALIAAVVLGGASLAIAEEQAHPAPAAFTAEQIKAAVDDYIQAKLEEGNGVYRLVDDKTGEMLELELVGIGIVGVGGLWRVHDPDRKREAGGYFACTDFRPVGAPRDKLYDIDLALSPRDGKLEVTEVRIHREPRFVGGKWVMVSR